MRTLALTGDESDGRLREVRRQRDGGKSLCCGGEKIKRKKKLINDNIKNK